VVCRMASCFMTLTAETDSGFTIGSTPTIPDSTRPIFAKFSGLSDFWAKMIAVKWGCYRPRDVVMATNAFLFNTHFVFSHAISPKLNEIVI